jgi:hypothetical protein
MGLRSMTHSLRYSVCLRRNPVAHRNSSKSSPPMSTMSTRHPGIPGSSSPMEPDRMTSNLPSRAMLRSDALGSPKRWIPSITTAEPAGNLGVSNNRRSSTPLRGSGSFRTSMARASVSRSKYA